MPRGRHKEAPGTASGCPGHGAPRAACEVQAGSGGEEVGENISWHEREEMRVYVTTNWEKSESEEQGSPSLVHSADAYKVMSV